MAYEFIATELVDGQSQPVLLDIVPHDQRADLQFRKVWSRLCQAIKNHHDCAASASACPSWARWNIVDRIQLSAASKDRQMYAAWDGDCLAGFVHVRPDFVNQSGQRLLYVETMAKAPGQLLSELWNPKGLKGVGEALLAFSVLRSKDLGYQGIIGLHADTDGVAGFYAGVAIDGIKTFGQPILNIDAPPPIGSKNAGRQYFESTADGSSALLEAYRHG